MNKKIIIILGISLIILMISFGSIYILNSDNNKEEMMMQDEMTNEPSKMMEENKMMQDDNKMTNEENKMMEKSKSKYVEYTKTNLESANDKKVLFFYASWCPTCRPADANFKANISKIPDNVTLIRVNYNDPETDQEEKDLAKKYNVTYQHTFVQIDENGKEITKWNGGQIDELLTNVK